MTEEERQSVSVRFALQALRLLIFFWLGIVLIIWTRSYLRWTERLTVTTGISLVVGLGLLVIRQHWRRGLRAERTVAGRCAKCGYDLRATPTVAPVR